jgi:glyoxylase-like metal-dependent hydrolase (beta-lactamase superfamily II)
MEPKEICDKVYAVGGGGLSHPADCCVYLVDAGSELVLIDAGAGLGIDRIMRNIKHLGFDPYQIGHIVATHCHIDHIGGIAPLQDLCGCKVIAHVLDRSGIEEFDGRLTAASLYGIEYRPVKIDTLLKAEKEMHTIGDIDFCFIHTPGHTPGSISVMLDLEGRVLFGQDIHGPFDPAWGSDIILWRSSMEKLLLLSADVLCEGHAGVLKGDEVNGYIQAQLRRFQDYWL